MAVGVEDIEVGFEEAMSWLPSYVLDEALVETGNKNQAAADDSVEKIVFIIGLLLILQDDVKYHYHHHRSKLPTEPLPPHSKASSRWHHKPRYSSKWASGGPGMQAFFLHSGQKSCGTGVFLPQRAGTNFQSSRRPACSPVLLPFRVVQALKLNVHELGLQISSRRDHKTNTSKGGELSSFNNKNEKDHVSIKRCVISQNESSSPEILLPKEWTY
ncbi:uncharacterized protein LOC111283546 [Durio zibethinus]|uniref:Uncharacterized protein LOC111283546 n=1 Tax=Durio zibethinus TaxID=66656 RepID=A0A6P5XJ04_DURZI|nr:uncharacterized protein LOC111283546 [Durio zibethinus]